MTKLNYLLQFQLCVIHPKLFITIKRFHFQFLISHRQKKISFQTGDNQKYKNKILFGIVYRMKLKRSKIPERNFFIKIPVVHFFNQFEHKIRVIFEYLYRFSKNQKISSKDICRKALFWASMHTHVSAQPKVYKSYCWPWLSILSLIRTYNTQRIMYKYNKLPFWFFLERLK